MVNQKLARRYAVAIAMLAGERNVAQRVGEDLGFLSEALMQPGMIRDFFVAPVIARPDKERVLGQIFDGKVDPVALHALLLLVRKRRESFLPAILEQYLELQRTAAGRQRVTLESARRLEPSEYHDLVRRLEQICGKTFEVAEAVNPELIAGIRLIMGDRRIDGSVAGRLEALARELSQGA
ncbi:MAG: ATP synthase F1 subunit delta [Candidatus Eremiobacteraeota bacterium]|nr:ATP synthase F1 subunit delta [Candidatus Eremiobacteraeota bacterium]